MNPCCLRDKGGGGGGGREGREGGREGGGGEEVTSMNHIPLYMYQPFDLKL